MEILMKHLFAALALLFAATVGAQPIQPFTADYDLLRDGKLIGKAQIALIMGKDGWQFSNNSEGTEGLAGFAGVKIEESSTFRWQNDVPETMHYRYFQKAAWKKKNRNVDIDHTAKRVTAGDDDGSVPLEYAPGTIDRNLVVLALAADLKAGATELEYRVADKREIGTHRYKIAAKEKLTTKRGSFDTIRVERLRDKPGRTTTTWIAPALGYIPARIVQTEPDGETLEMLLR
jgi:Protein of unknown function (DUF3108)